jgi:DNA-directed RNA polymerase specialized sigma24 family protein
MTENAANYLTTLAARARELAAALSNYQQALVEARQLGGASYPQLAKALGTSESGARWRCKTAQAGGELHLRLDPHIPEPRKGSHEK